MEFAADIAFADERLCHCFFEQHQLSENCHVMFGRFMEFFSSPGGLYLERMRETGHEVFLKKVLKSTRCVSGQLFCVFLNHYQSFSLNSSSLVTIFIFFLVF